MNLKIRPGLLFDIQTIAEFQLMMAQETEKLELDLATVLKGVGAVIDDPTKGKYWVAESEGEVVGCLLTIPEWSDWRNGTVLWIHSVYVIPSYRRRGVFKSLYLHVKEMVSVEKDLRGIRLYVDKSNREAQVVYESLGMSGDHYHLLEWMKSF